MYNFIKLRSVNAPVHTIGMLVVNNFINVKVTSGLIDID